MLVFGYQGPKKMETTMSDDARIEAVAEAIFRVEFPADGEWSWSGDGHTEGFKDAFRLYAKAALEELSTRCSCGRLHLAVGEEVPSGGVMHRLQFPCYGTAQSDV